MSKHFEFQREMTDYVVSNIYPANLSMQIYPGGKLKDPIKALDIHKNGYVFRLTEVLGDSYEAVWWVLGEEFLEIAETYIKKNPSHCYNLNDYGPDLCDYIKASRQSIEFPFLEDLARFEWLFQTVYNKKQHISVAATKLSHLGVNPNAEITFGNSVNIFKSDFSIYEIWKRRKNKDCDLSGIQIQKNDFLLIYKKDQRVFVYQLTEKQYYLMQNLLKEKSLQKAIESISEDDNLEEVDVSSLFQIIAAEGLVEQISHTELNNF